MCTLMLVWSEHWVFLLFLQCYGGFLFFEYCLSSGGLFFFFVLFVGGASCVFIHLLHSSLVLFILGVLGPRGFSLAGRVMFSFCVGLRCVECRSGTIYLSASWGWVAGLYRFFPLGLCCGGYGTIYLSAGRGCGLFVFAVSSLLSALSAGGCLW